MRKGAAPDERQALILGRALWEAVAGEKTAKSMPAAGVERAGAAWIVQACDPRSEKGEILDGCAYIVFDSRDGGVFMGSEINPPTREQIAEALKRRRQSVGIKK